MKEKARILIVDDDPSMVRTMALILGHKGHAVTTAQHGPAAVEEAKRQAFDLILMDIKMPLMDGVETYRRIKKIRPEAVVLMMTAYAVEDLVRQALEEGAYGVLYKPLDIDRVVDLIEKARSGREAALILVVDDDVGTCITLRNILARRGYDVGTAHNGEDAIAMARENGQDIIFIDLKLPTINGLETYLAIREINPRAVAIMMTGYRQEMAELVEEALRNDAYTCLYKPLDVEEMLRLIDGILERRARTQTLGRSD